MTALVGGVTDLYLDAAKIAQAQIDAGKARALAVTGRRRSGLLPNLPTVGESLGLADFEAGFTVGFFAPKGTPPEIIDKLSAEVAAAVGDPDSKQRFVALGMEAVGNTPGEFKAQIAAEVTRVETTVKRLRAAGLME